MSCGQRVVISVLNLAVFDGGKNLDKNLWAKSCHVVILLAGREFNQILALSRRENGNNLNLMASSVTSLYLKVAQISMKLARWTSGSSVTDPLNWFAYIIWIRDGLISKLFAWTVGNTIPVTVSFTTSKAYTIPILSFSSVTHGVSSQSQSFFFSFLFLRHVLSILESKGIKFPLPDCLIHIIVTSERPKTRTKHKQKKEKFKLRLELFGIDINN